MSLFKQVAIVLSVVFLILFILVVGLSFNIIKNSAAKSLYESIQNSVTGISLSITNSGVGEHSVQTILNASFDNGNYAKIVFKNTNEEIVYERKKEIALGENGDIPKWFVDFVDIGDISAITNVSEGWKLLGTLEIYADRKMLYKQIYTMFIKIFESLILIYVLLIILFHFLFTFILRPLKTIDKQAKAVINNEFIISDKVPFTEEFKSLTFAINSMIKKFESIFKNTNEILKTNKELLYFDEHSKINNRKYFILKVNEYLDKDSINNTGFLVLINLNIQDINKTCGFIKTDKLLFDLGNKMKECFIDHVNIVTRLNGSDFAILIPNSSEEFVKENLEKLIKSLKSIEEFKNNIHFGILKYTTEDDIKKIFTKIDYTLSQAKIHTEQEYFYAKNVQNQKLRTKEEWINILNISLEKEYYQVVYRDIVDINSKEQLLKTVSFEIDFEGEIIKYGELIAPILEQNILDKVCLYIIEKVMNSYETGLISIQLPTIFITKSSNYIKLKEILEKYKNISNNIIFEIEEGAFNNNLNSVLGYIQLFKEFNFKFAIFNFILHSDDYNYLKELKPMYIKASKLFLLESKQHLSILKILTQSLGIKLIATSVDEISEIEILKQIEIDAVSGSVMTKL